MRLQEKNAPKQQIYSDANYTYICTAPPGSVLSAAVWRVVRYDVNGNSSHADGNQEFDNVATNLATVAGLTYS